MVEPSQISGAILGQCLGDALGFPVEGRSGPVCAFYVNDELRTGKIGLRTRGDLSFGQYTDDSQLMRELLQSYVAHREFRPEDYAARLVAIFEEERIVGYGRATLQAIEQLKRGVHWSMSGTPPPAAGNGSAMRAGAIGLIAYKDMTRLTELAVQQGIITHQDPRCSAGAIAIAGAVALALQREIETASFCERLAALTEETSHEMAALLRQLPEWVALPQEQAFFPIEKAGRPAGYMDEWSGMISPFVISSVLWSLYAFLRHPQSYWDAICTAIWPGGDVDTTAAMTGAISGAYLGESALPNQWVERLNDRGTWRAAELRNLAREVAVL